MIRVLQVHTDTPNPRHIQFAAGILGDGKLVLTPTETGYCFIGDADRPETLQAFLKLRHAHPKQKPFSLLCQDIAQAAKVAVINTPTFRVASRVWPGPYTFVLESNRYTPKAALGPKRKSVGIRVSDNTVAAALVHAFGSPLLITSVTDAEELDMQDYYSDPLAEDHWWTQAESICSHFSDDLIGCALAVPDPTPMRVSTVVDFSQEAPVVLRDGGWDLDPLGLSS